MCEQFYLLRTGSLHQSFCSNIELPSKKTYCFVIRSDRRDLARQAGRCRPSKSDENPSPNETWRSVHANGLAGA